MKFFPVVAITAVMAAVAGPLAAQQAAPQYDQNAPVTLEGTADTVNWSQTEGKLTLQPKTGSQMWDIALPNTRTLLDKGVSAEVLRRGVPVTVHALKSKDPACNPNCKAQAVDLTLDSKTYAVLGAAAPG